eukprot:EG_transcript_21530
MFDDILAEGRIVSIKMIRSRNCGTTQSIPLFSLMQPFSCLFFLNPRQCLLTLLDSPLNRAGLLQVFIKTRSGTLIEIHPQTHIPRSFWLFSRMMVQFTKSHKIRAAGAPYSLLRAVKNPVVDHLPGGCRRIGTSLRADKKVNLQEWVNTLPDEPIAVVIGGISRGSFEVDYVDDSVCISEFPLSASVVCSKFCNAFEARWVPEPD